MNAITTMDDINGRKSETAFKPPQLTESSQKNKSYKHSRFFYTVGLFNFLLEESIKVENLYEFTINNVPNAPKWCTGVTSVRGHIMPVVNMHIFLKTGKQSNVRRKKLMMLEHKQHSPIVFEIDRLPELISMDHYMDVPMPTKAPRWLKKALKNDQNVIYEINHAELLQQLKKSQQ